MKFLFQITDVKKELLTRFPDFALDGNLTILIKDEIFFDEEGISLLGLAIYVASWLNETKANRFTDFDYSSDEYQDNPVLHLTKLKDHRYTITSSWTEASTHHILSLEEITHCFDFFLQELNNAIKQDYDVAFSEMTFLSQLYRMISEQPDGSR